MTFKHKLSCRLALMRDRWMVLSTVALALAALAACEKPISLTGPDTSAVLRLVISPKVLTLRPHQVADFTAVGLTSTGVTGSTHVSWSVTSGSMTDTSTTGDQHYARYQAGADAGAAKVVVSGRPGGIADTAIISVMPAPVASVAVSPATMSVQVGGTVQLAAATKDSAGNPLSGRAVAWMSSNPAIAAASPSGLVTAVAAGAATITATSEDRKSTRLNSSHTVISYAVFCLKKKNLPEKLPASIGNSVLAVLFLHLVMTSEQPYMGTGQSQAIGTLSKARKEQPGSAPRAHHA